MPNGRRESYEAVLRRPEQQETEGPALSMSPVYSVPLLPCLKPSHSTLLPCLKHTQSPSQPSVTHRTCSSVTLSPISSNLFTCLLVHLLTRLVTLSPISSNLFTCLLVHLLTRLVTLSPVSSNLFTCLLVHLLTRLVTLSFSYPVSLSTLSCPYPVTKKVKPYSFTFFFFPLLSLLIRSRAVTTKTYFVCPP